jgi:hypothetical protein
MGPNGAHKEDRLEEEEEEDTGGFDLARYESFLAI